MRLVGTTRRSANWWWGLEVLVLGALRGRHCDVLGLMCVDATRGVGVQVEGVAEQVWTQASADE